MNYLQLTFKVSYSGVYFQLTNIRHWKLYFLNRMNNFLFIIIKLSRINFRDLCWYIYLCQIYQIRFKLYECCRSRISQQCWRIIHIIIKSFHQWPYFRSAQINFCEEDKEQRASRNPVRPTCTHTHTHTHRRVYRPTRSIPSLSDIPIYDKTCRRTQRPSQRRASFRLLTFYAFKSVPQSHPGGRRGTFVPCATSALYF